MGRPMPNRLIMGATAIVTQPFIDENNKRVDKDTARASRNRTIGKIVAGTAVGCVVREGIYQLVQRTTHKDISVDRWNNFLTPRGTSVLSPTVVKNMMRNYRSVFATILAMVVMVFTNILFDAPLTTKISNYLNKRDAKKKIPKENIVPESQVQPVKPKDKIKDAFGLSKGGQL